MLNSAVSSSNLPSLQAPRAPQPANGQAGAPTAADEAPDAFARQLAQAQSAKTAAANANAARAAAAAREAQDRLAREAAAPRADANASAKPAAEASAEATDEAEPEPAEGGTGKTSGNTDPAAWLASLLPGGAERLARGRQGDTGPENGGPGGRRSAGVGTAKGAPGTELAGRVEGQDAATGAGTAGAANSTQAAPGEAAGRFAAALAEATQKAEAAAPQAAQRSDTTAPAADAVRALAAADGTTPTAPSAPAEAAGPAAPFTSHLAAALDSPAFAPALGAQVSMLVRDGIQQARLELNPAEMGPISVQIDLTGTQAHVSFGADMAATRAALENSLPDLAAALSAGGFTLAGGGVFAQNSGAGGQPGRDDNGRREGGVRGVGGTAGGDDLAALAPAQPLRPARGVVDLIA